MSKQTRLERLWVPRRVGTVTRYYRERRDGVPGLYNVRHVMEPGSAGKPSGRKWALFYGDSRIWEVQPHTMLSTAIEAAEEWLART